MKKRILSLLIILVMLTGLAGCKGKTSENTVKIGSKDFTESFIVAELYALALEQAGFEVERKFNLGGTNVTQEAMQKGDLDLYPEYTGTCLLNVLKEEPMKDPEELYAHVKSVYEADYHMTLLDASTANNSQGLVVTRSIAKQYGIQTISDLQKNASLIRFASQGAFEENADGMPALTGTYGEFTFRSVEYYDNAIKYELLKNDKADLAVAFTTDGQLTDPDFVLLEDDKAAWPSYNIVPVIRQDSLEKHPQIEEALNRVSAALDTETMQQLNAKVDLEKEEPEDVAAEFFQENLNGRRG